jgi:hypothetical protein
MAEAKYEFWIEAQGKGFFGCPSVGPDVRLPKSYHDNPGLVCAHALDRAKKGDFTPTTTILNLYGTTGRPIVDSMVLGLIAYAGPTSCFLNVVDVVKRTADLSKVLDFCGVMAERGELAYIPIFLDKYLSNQSHRDAEYLIDYIGDLMGAAFDTFDPEDYKETVLTAYRQLIATLGSEKVLVFRGERYGVVRLARYLLNAVKEPYFRSSFRRSFEAATGIDCSSWYQDGKLLPLAATATLEEFLESPDAAKYEDGVRYFFGHRIPD